MKFIAIFFTILGIVFLIGMIYHIAAYVRPSIYPPKKIIKERIAILGSASLFLLFIGIVTSILLK